MDRKTIAMSIEIECCGGCPYIDNDLNGSLYCDHENGPTDFLKNLNKIHKDCPLLEKEKE
jgi:hypothetical protein